jgi:adenine deaminase
MGLGKNLDLFNLLRAVTLNPKNHYHLGTGLLQIKDSADFIVIDDLKNFNVQETWIGGKKVFERNKVLFGYEKPESINNFHAGSIELKDLKIKMNGSKIRILRAYDGELFTGEEIMTPTVSNGEVITDPDRDMAKIVVLNRYRPAKPVIGFITGFGLKKGAFASSIAHDSHNLIAIGTNDEDILVAMNSLIRSKGGISITNGLDTEVIKLEVGGLMSSDDPEVLAKAYASMNDKAASFCSSIKSPFMTLAFMALLVIPELKIGDQGLFNVTRFEKTSLFV